MGVIMATAEIKAALKRKGLIAEPQYIRGHSGGGWLINLDVESEQKLINSNFDGDFDPDYATAAEVAAWIETLPAL